MARVLAQEPLLNNVANAADAEWWMTTKECLHFLVHASVAMVEATSSKHHVLDAVAQEWKCVHAKSMCAFHLESMMARKFD
jgi:hypothetical protein